MKVLCPLPSRDFDPTEVSIPWKLLKEQNIEVVFATPSGEVAKTDEIMLHGKGLGPFKMFLVADESSQVAYRALINSNEFKHPISYEQMNGSYDGLLMPGGHAKGMREYLESKEVQNIVVDYFKQDKVVAAICHGTLAVARSIDPLTNKSVLYGRTTTGLNFLQELLAWLLTFLWMGDYYRTYKIWMQHDVESHLEKKSDFLKGPMPLLRDSIKNLNYGYAHIDGNYISGRWPGDAHTFSCKMIEMLKAKGQDNE